MPTPVNAPPWFAECPLPGARGRLQGLGLGVPELLCCHGVDMGGSARGASAGVPRQGGVVAFAWRSAGRRPRRPRGWGWEPAKVACNGHDHRVEWAAGCFLSKLAGCKAEDVSVDAQAAHVLVASAEAGSWIASVDEAVDPGHGAVPMHQWSFDGSQNSAAASEYGKVISVLQVRAPGEVSGGSGPRKGRQPRCSLPPSPSTCCCRSGRQ
jgi:hypothetical protein